MLLWFLWEFLEANYSPFVACSLFTCCGPRESKPGFLWHSVYFLFFFAKFSSSQVFFPIFSVRAYVRPSRLMGHKDNMVNFSGKKGFFFSNSFFSWLAQVHSLYVYAILSVRATTDGSRRMYVFGETRLWLVCSAASTTSFFLSGRSRDNAG